MEDIHCNLCNSEGTTLKIVACDQDRITAEHFRLVQCRQCGLAYVSPRPSLDEIQKYYPIDYKPHQRKTSWRPDNQSAYRQEFIHGVAHLFYAAPPRSRVAVWLSLQPELLRDLIKVVARPLRYRLSILPRYQAPGYLLDFGCGAGNYLDIANDLGWHTFGVDMNTQAVMLAREKGHDVRLGPLEKLAWPDAYFQAITLWHSLEHLHDPLATVQELHRISAPGAEMLLEVPNLNSLSFAIYGSHWYALDLPRHLFHFNPQTIQQLLEKAGFQIRELTLLSHKYITANSEVLRQRDSLDELTVWHRLVLYLRQNLGRGDLIRVRAVRL